MTQARVNFKAIFLLGLILASLSGAWLGAQDVRTNVLLSAPVDQIATGETLTVSIQIENVENVYGGRIKLAYDPNLLEVVLNEDTALTAGEFFSGQPGMTLRNMVDPVAGIVDYALTLRRPAEPVSGSGLIGTVTFRALASGTANFELVDVSLSSPRFEEVNGQRIATAVDTIPVNIQTLSLNVSGESVAPSAPPIVEEVVIQPEVLAQEALAPMPSSLFNRPVMPSIAPRGPSPAIIIGIVFFVLGLLMFMSSLLAFIRLRQNFRLAY